MEKVTSEYADSSHREETLQILRGFRWRKILHISEVFQSKKKIANFKKILDGGSYPTMRDFLPSNKRIACLKKLL